MVEAAAELPPRRCQKARRLRLVVLQVQMLGGMLDEVPLLWLKPVVISMLVHHDGAEDIRVGSSASLVRSITSSCDIADFRR